MDVLEPCIKSQKENLTRIPLISYRNIHRESVKQVTKIGLMYKVGSFLARCFSLVPASQVGYTIHTYFMRSI